MKLSIIVAAYNVEKYIEKCLLSCIQDVSHSYEILVVNDGSTDHTLEILSNLASVYNIIKVIDQPNSGLGAARNSGMQHSKGAYLWFIDGDDYVDAKSISSILKEVDSKQLDTLILDYAAVDEQYVILGQHRNTPQSVQGVFTGGDYYEANYSKSYTPLFVFKRSLFTKNNILFKERINMQDSEILPKLLIDAQRVSFLDEICYYYLQQSESFTNSDKGEKRFTYFESIIAVRDFLEAFLIIAETQNPKIANGIRKKLLSIHHIVYNHLIYVRYQKDWLVKIIALLKDNKLYPLQYSGNIKAKVLAPAMNLMPQTTKKVIDTLRKT